MNKIEVLTTVTVSVLIGISIGLTLYKLETKLSWKQVILIKFKVLVMIPIINMISKRITSKKRSLGRLYEIRNKLNDKLLN